jgi:hypothetical protein
MTPKPWRFLSFKLSYILINLPFNKKCETIFNVNKMTTYTSAIFGSPNTLLVLNWYITEVKINIYILISFDQKP